MLWATSTVCPEGSSRTNRWCRPPSASSGSTRTTVPAPSTCSFRPGTSAASTRSWYQWSRSGSIATSCPVRLTTSTFFTDGEAALGDFTVKVTGHPTKGGDVSRELDAA